MSFRKMCTSLVLPLMNALMSALTVAIMVVIMLALVMALLMALTDWHIFIKIGKIFVKFRTFRTLNKLPAVGKVKGTNAPQCTTRYCQSRTTGAIVLMISSRYNSPFWHVQKVSNTLRYQCPRACNADYKDIRFARRRDLMNTSKRKGHAYFSGLLEGNDYGNVGV